jgi:hypothetical protein
MAICKDCELINIQELFEDHDDRSSGIGRQGHRLAAFQRTPIRHKNSLVELEESSKCCSLCKLFWNGLIYTDILRDERISDIVEIIADRRIGYAKKEQICLGVRCMNKTAWHGLFADKGELYLIDCYNHPYMAQYTFNASLSVFQVNMESNHNIRRFIY